MCPRNSETELREAVDRILASKSRRKLVVAGPGTGKTTLFKKLLDASAGDRDSRLVLTFINNLKVDLERTLGMSARVLTLHGYCQSLLRRKPGLRAGLSENFRCVPEMASLIKRDWEYLKEGPTPVFVQEMRSLNTSSALNFYFARANYYDAVDFDDSVFRTYLALDGNRDQVDALDLVLIDEFQDFNRMEAAFIELVASRDSIVIAGDDDQALYSQLRGASWDHIRALCKRGDYEVFPLPFCMRCPEVIVGAVNDVISRARDLQKLNGRIDKPYRHYEPRKGEDSHRYPKVVLVETTVQRANANYFGRYIEEAVRLISAEEIDEASKNHEPTVLVIGPQQYRNPVSAHLIEAGLPVEIRPELKSGIAREAGLEILAEDPVANIGWRIVLEDEDRALAAKCVQMSAPKAIALVRTIPESLREKIIAEVKAWKNTADQREKAKQPADEAGGMRIKLTSFEGAKGLSAQHVFILGLHAGDLPKDSTNITDIEVCRFLVGLTRTKKQCLLLYTRRFAGQVKTKSPFLDWIRKERYAPISVDVAYWKDARHQRDRHLGKTGAVLSSVA